MKFPTGTFDSAQLAILQTTFELVCEELGVNASDRSGRERIAEAMMALARAGQYDSDKLKIYAISRFKARDLEGSF
jgi:hypothetical protein